MTLTADDLWNALRDVACTTGRKAQRIVLVHRSDVERALAKVTAWKPLPEAGPVSQPRPND